MINKESIFSLDEKGLLEMTVSDIVAGNPQLSRVFQATGIEFCCQGKLTLKQACERRGVDPDEMVSAIKREANSSHQLWDQEFDLPLNELMDLLVERHHAYIQRELPRIYAMAERVAHVHGGHTPSLIEVHLVFNQLAEELTAHINEEVETLFPAIREQINNPSNKLVLEDPVHFRMIEHDHIDEAFNRLRDLTNEFNPPPEACNTYRALFAGLADLVSTARELISIENEILFPGSKK